MTEGAHDLPQIPTAPAAAVAENEEHLAVAAMPDEETISAIKWSSDMQQKENILSMIRSLPSGVVEEHLDNYRNREITKETAFVE